MDSPVYDAVLWTNYLDVRLKFVGKRPLTSMYIASQDRRMHGRQAYHRCLSWPTSLGRLEGRMVKFFSQHKNRRGSRHAVSFNMAPELRPECVLKSPCGHRGCYTTATPRANSFREEVDAMSPGARQSLGLAWLCPGSVERTHFRSNLGKLLGYLERCVPEAAAAWACLTL